ncbi:uncharacterized protein LOC135809212 [Sycon ciliatum]|uniref:uncharacterized protein LOC135809212 n=1 Tax=Sycon ciliatum TaxID=27933 RepID=UPI0031F6BA70
MELPEPVTVLDYGAGNIRSLLNALKKHGVEPRFVKSAADIAQASKLIFPGVGAFGQSMNALEKMGYTEALRAYLKSNRPFLGICLGLQTLYEGSEESPGVAGLGAFSGVVRDLNNVKVDEPLTVPHMGWNEIRRQRASKLFAAGDQTESTSGRYYFTHSFAIPAAEADATDVLATTDHGVPFVSVVQRGNIVATQFHPEKSGEAGLDLIRRFLQDFPYPEPSSPVPFQCLVQGPTVLARRVIACLDVRSNDAGDLVVTKGEQYDVRERATEENGATKRGEVRNLGKPVDLARRYFQEGADEVVFLNITSFRDSPLHDQPMLDVLRRTSEHVFVPLCVGGGIRDITVPAAASSTDGGAAGDSITYPAVEVAGEYFRSGADKVSIGSDAVRAAVEYMQSGAKTGKTAIETIAEVYGSQAVVISVDPKRAYAQSPADVPGKQHCIETKYPGPDGEMYCWYQCTTAGGRVTTDVGAWEMVRACEALGAGEIMLNCINRDGTNAGYDLELIADIKSAVRIPVIASSGAGCPEHFSEVFAATGCDAALAAGIFHRKEVPIGAVKEHLNVKEVTVRYNP